MTLIDQLAQFLNDNAIATLGDDLFIEQLNANPASAMMIASNVSPAPDQYLATQEFDFEVWSRDPEPKVASERLTNVFMLLHRFHHIQLGYYYIYFIGALGNIENAGKDMSGRSLHTLRFRSIYMDTRTIS